MMKDEIEAENKKIQDAELRASQIEKVMIKVRKKLYIFSGISAVYLVHGVRFRFQNFENTTTGIGFPDGLAIVGVDEMVVETALLVTMAIILCRFTWYSTAFVLAKFACYHLNTQFAKNQAEQLLVYKEHHPQIEHEEEMHSATIEGMTEDDIRYVAEKYTRRRRLVSSGFNMYGELDTMIITNNFHISHRCIRHV